MSLGDITIASAYTPGSGVLNVAGMGLVLSTYPVVPNQVTVFQRSTWNQPNQVSGTYSLTGANGNAITGLTLISGTDSAWTPGDFVLLQSNAAALSSITASALFDQAFGSAQGDVLYRNSTVWVALAPGSSGQVLTSGGASANPSWATASGSGTVTSASVVSANGFTGTVATATTTPAITLTTSITGILTGNGTAIAAATEAGFGTSGQFNQTAIAQPGTLVAGDMWYDSTKLCRVTNEGSATSADCMVGSSVRLLYSQSAPVTVTATGVSSMLAATLSLPAGFLNVANRVIEATIDGYITTAASAEGNIWFAAKLGSNIIATTAQGTLAASKTAVGFTVQYRITTDGTGSSGTLQTGGTAISAASSAVQAWPNIALQNGTTIGTPVPGTPVTLDLTAAYALDLQLDLSAASSVNTVVITNVNIKVLGG